VLVKKPWVSSGSWPLTELTTVKDVSTLSPTSCSEATPLIAVTSRVVSALIRAASFWAI
jgi:hypothetical protein